MAADKMAVLHCPILKEEDEAASNCLSEFSKLILRSCGVIGMNHAT